MHEWETFITTNHPNSDVNPSPSVFNAHKELGILQVLKKQVYSSSWLFVVDCFFGNWQTQFSSNVKNQRKMYHSYFITMRLAISPRYVNLSPTSLLQHCRSIRARGRDHSLGHRCVLLTPPSLLTNGYPHTWIVRSVKLIDHLHLLPIFRSHGDITHFFMYLHGWCLSTWTTLPCHITNPFIPRGLKSIKESKSPNETTQGP
jgi:hypothetical protein